jgi:hypothetical protein
VEVVGQEGQDANANNPVNLADELDDNSDEASAHIDGMSDDDGGDDKVRHNSVDDKDADPGQADDGKENSDSADQGNAGEDEDVNAGQNN